MTNAIFSAFIVSLAAVAVGLVSVPASAQVPPTAIANATLPLDLAREIVSKAEEGTREAAVKESSGPWGILRSSYVYIAAPDHILQLFTVPSAVTTWTFVGLSRADVATLFDESDVPAALRAELAEDSRWESAGEHVQFRPSAAAIVSLPPRARARIYGVLARWEVNEFHYDPYFVPEGDVRLWLGQSGLRPEVVDAITRTAYTSGKSLCFSDLPLLVSLSQSHAESRTLIKALSRTRTAILSLRLESEADADRIRDYWDLGRVNAKDFLPLIESVAATPAIPQLDVVHVLPPNVRKLCYTYPHPSQAVGGRYPDCHWTSLNFFNYRPEERLFDLNGVGMYARENYDRAEGPYRFGDILFFADAHGDAIHSCVYLADDFVFTKNGANVISPWLIMKLSDVVERYSIRAVPEIRVYRRRPE